MAQPFLAVLLLVSACVKLLPMQRKIFWLLFATFGLIADFTLPFVWAVVATFPILALSWWLAYRSNWFPD
ncbi:MAG TPA: hypothetical protein VGR58_10910 [Candidatus Acidoferrum sp.]|nr:hypothetical protein [Candidatus Acidoferrum sp.]